MRRALTDRQSRTPLDLARMLAAKYPANPIMSYIPALSWSGALRVSALTGDPRYRDRAVAQMAAVPVRRRSRRSPSRISSPAWPVIRRSSISPRPKQRRGRRPARKAADFILATTPDEIVRFATAWTDDMFMATSVLARAAARTGDAKYADAVARLLTSTRQRLQREDRLFIHAESGPHAWGRGNGFAAFGLMEALTHLPESWPARLRSVLEASPADERHAPVSGARRRLAPGGGRAGHLPRVHGDGDDRGGDGARGSGWAGSTAATATWSNAAGGPCRRASPRPATWWTSAPAPAPAPTPRATTT